MNLKKIAESVLPFLFGEVTKEWDSLTPAEQQALIHSGQIGQIIKEQIANGPTAVVNAIASQLNLTPDQVNSTLITIFSALGYNLTTTEGTAESKVDAGINQLQAKINSGLSDPDWNALWETVTGTAVSLASKNPVNWLNVISVVGKFVYDKFIKKS
jgi:hypothetical protein